MPLSHFPFYALGDTFSISIKSLTCLSTIFSIKLFPKYAFGRLPGLSDKTSLALVLMFSAEYSRFINGGYSFVDIKDNTHSGSVRGRFAKCDGLKLGLFVVGAQPIERLKVSCHINVVLGV